MAKKDQATTEAVLTTTTDTALPSDEVQLSASQGETLTTNDVVVDENVTIKAEGSVVVKSDKIKSVEVAEDEPKKEETKRSRGRPPKAEETFKLGLFKLNEFTQDPSYGTTHSACFDIRVNLKGLYEQGIERVKAITRTNQAVERKIEVDVEGRLYVDLRPHERLLAPTGAIFDIPVGYSLKVHPRSGTSLKQGINLINQEGVIDADYVEELFLPLVNSSENYVKIYDAERYAQGELQEVIQAEFVTLDERPAQKSEREGGFGHTGVK